MGVPAMFRWLSNRYPKIIEPVKEELPKRVDGEIIPVDYTKPNPNDVEFDNLYLDMNGIVHPCSHPEDKPAPQTEAEMMLAVFEYTDRIVGMVRPRKLLYMAVDGVAPRAKMNQQRSRRFRAAKEAKEKDAAAEEYKAFVKARSQNSEAITSLEEVVKKTWDSNAITPGTEFMHLLAESLQFWSAYKFTTDPSWKDLKVIISDASVPGEGEHKIMNFIRYQRSHETHDPNTSHVLYGLDADLIMLGLATHEPHFRVLREDVFYDSNKSKTCTNCGKSGHVRLNCALPPLNRNDRAKMKPNEEPEEGEEVELTSNDYGEALAKAGRKPFIWLKVNVLREYLAVEMETEGRRFPYNLERALDDWVFLCFFVGNDFLPHLPSLDIRDQSIDLLVGIWRKLVPRWDSYVTHHGYPDMHKVQQILTQIAQQESTIFKERHEQEERRKAREERKQRYKSNGNGQPPWKRRKEDTQTYLTANIPFTTPDQLQSNSFRKVHDNLQSNNFQANKAAAAALKATMKAKDTEMTDTSSENTSAPGISVSLGKRKADMLEESDSGTPGRSTPIPKSRDEEMPEDTVRLWEDGYEDRYYQQKFKAKPGDLEFRHEVAREYAKGLCWVLAYYFQGCPSWTWYYPYHYAPFAQDFENLGELKPHKMFQQDTPLKPYEQLMGVLPAASSHAIPEPFRQLMSDPTSPIIDFYPEDFPIDLNGKKFAWQGVAILPFIDIDLLLKAMKTKYPQLSDREHKRNAVGKETLIFSQENDLFNIVDKAFYRVPMPQQTKIDHETSNGLHGSMEHHDTFAPDSLLVPPFESDHSQFEELHDKSMRVHYFMEKLKKKEAHKSKLLDNVKLPKEELNDEDKKYVLRGKGGSLRGHGGFGRDNRPKKQGLSADFIHGGAREAYPDGWQERASKQFRGAGPYRHSNNDRGLLPPINSETSGILQYRPGQGSAPIGPPPPQQQPRSNAPGYFPAGFPVPPSGFPVPPSGFPAPPPGFPVPPGGFPVPPPGFPVPPGFPAPSPSSSQGHPPSRFQGQPPLSHEGRRYNGHPPRH